MSEINNHWKRYSDVKNDKEYIKRHQYYTFLVFATDCDDQKSVIDNLENLIGKNVRFSSGDFRLYNLSVNGVLIDDDGDPIEAIDPCFESYSEVFIKPLTI